MTATVVGYGPKGHPFRFSVRLWPHLGDSRRALRRSLDATLAAQIAELVAKGCVGVRRVKGARVKMPRRN